MMNTQAITDKLKNINLSSLQSENPNVNMPERLLSIAGGALIAYKGLKQLKQHPVIAIEEAMVGGMLLYRGATGYCPVYGALNKDSTDTGAIHISETFMVDKPRNEVYAFWRKLENLPRFMKHLSSVEEQDNKRSQWRANLPGELVKLTWNAEITREEENSYIGWQSTEGSMVDNAGKVRFDDALNGSGTQLTVDISYFPPAGSLGQGIAKLLNGIFENMVREDILNFKHYMEGEEYKTYQDNSASKETEKPENSFK
jgi:uncharacterized membrane protein